jgi:hypothetical protein
MPFTRGPALRCPHGVESADHSELPVNGLGDRTGIMVRDRIGVPGHRIEPAISAGRMVHVDGARRSDDFERHVVLE